MNTYWGLSAYEYIRQYGYVPAGVLDTSSVGRQTREGSRTLEYAFEDFGIRQVAQLLGHEEDLAEYTNRSYVSFFQHSIDTHTDDQKVVPQRLGPER